MNLGQLSMLLRAKYLVDVVGCDPVRGLPIKAAELADAIGELVTEIQKARRGPHRQAQEAIQWTIEMPFAGLRSVPRRSTSR